MEKQCFDPKIFNSRIAEEIDGMIVRKGYQLDGNGRVAGMVPKYDEDAEALFRVLQF